MGPFSDAAALCNDTYKEARFFHEAVTESVFALGALDIHLFFKENPV